ncbi:MAG: glycosyltransferase family 4 protein [Planctomycetota bacterium]
MSDGARPWLLVSGDFVTTGGQDRANHALARHLLARGVPVHLVAYRADPLLLAAGARLHRAPKPGGSYLLGEPLLDQLGRRWARRLRGARVLANGGNCPVAELNWVHYVHAADGGPPAGGSPGRRLKAALQRRLALRAEREALRRARLVFANSRRTARDLITRVGVAPSKLRVLYLGADAERFRPAAPQERRAEREALGWDPDARTAVFVGSPRDPRKGFDRVLAAWARLGQDRPELAVLGGGDAAALARQASRARLRLRFLGLRPDPERVLRASDLLVSPTRYEPYGLGVHEALCCGLPALVSRSAGVAERYPRALSGLLLRDVEDELELARGVSAVLAELEAWRARVAPVGEALRSRTWDDMARDLVERAGGL